MAEDEIKDLNLERRILRAVRLTLASVVKDATPSQGEASFLSPVTIENIKECFLLVSLREKELADRKGLKAAKPLYPGQQA